MSNTLIQDVVEVDEPSDDTLLWRYYDTSQFIALLERESFWIARLDQFDDPFEGYGPPANIEHSVNRQKAHIKQINEKYGAGIEVDFKDTLKSSSRLRKQFLANSWSIAKDENGKANGEALEMWNSYLTDGDGVAIYTTYGRLKDAIEEWYDGPYFASKVHYADYFDEVLDGDGFFDYVTTKPRQYEFEREVRLMLIWKDCATAFPQVEDIKPEEGLPYPPTGVELRVDLTYLLEGVVLSPFHPPWLTIKRLNAILDEFGFNHLRAEVSPLAMTPDDVVKNLRKGSK